MTGPIKDLTGTKGSAFSTSNESGCEWLGGAWFSPDGAQRYLLWRDRGVEPENHIVFCMLNPSTAGAEPDDDATIRKLKGFATRWGNDSFSVINLSPEIATDPNDARFGQLDTSNLNFNEAVWRHVLPDASLVCAWGAHTKAEELRLQFLSIARATCAELLCLGLTKSGHPRHPGRISYDTPLTQYVP